MQRNKVERAGAVPTDLVAKISLREGTAGFPKQVGWRDPPKTHARSRARRPRQTTWVRFPHLEDVLWPRRPHTFRSKVSRGVEAPPTLRLSPVTEGRSLWHCSSK